MMPADKKAKYSVQRNVLDAHDVLEGHPLAKKEKKPPFYKDLPSKMKTLTPLGIFNFIFPFFVNLKSFYTMRLFLSDVLSGLTVSSLHIPQGMAYGKLAGLKPVNGIYTSFFPALFYLLFGASRHVSIGTFSVMSLLVAEPVDRLTDAYLSKNETIGQDAEDAYRLKVGVTVTVISGIIQLLMGMFRLGLLVVYIPPAILAGFTCGAAMHVFASQLNGFFGIRMKRAIGPGRLLFTAKYFVETVPKTNLVTFMISCICLVVLVLFKFFINPRVHKKIHFSPPIELILIIVTTMVSYFAKLNEKYNVAIAGTLPKELPSPVLPDFRLTPQVWVESFIVAFVSMATTLSVVKLFATRFSYPVGYTREMSALGLSNIFGGFFQCHAASGGLARTTVAVVAGMQSQVATLVSCAVLLLVLTCIGPLLRTLPLCVLSAIILIALKGILVQMLQLPKFYRTSKVDLSIWIVTFLATVFVDIPYGLLTGLGFSLLTILYRTHTSERRELGPILGTDIYLPRKQYENTDELPGIAIVQTAGPIYYANCDAFKDWLAETTGIDPDMMQAKSDKTDQSAKQTGENLSCWQKTSQRFACCKLTRRRGDQTRSAQPNDDDEARERLAGASYELKAVGTEDKLDGLKFIIIDLSGCTFTDMVGANILIKLVQAYKKVKIEILFCHCSQHVRSILVNSGFDAAELDKTSFPTIHDAVLNAQQAIQETNQNADTSEKVKDVDQGVLSV